MERIDLNVIEGKRAWHRAQAVARRSLCSLAQRLLIKSPLAARYFTSESGIALKTAEDINTLFKNLPGPLQIIIDDLVLKAKNKPEEITRDAKQYIEKWLDESGLGRHKDLAPNSAREKSEFQNDPIGYFVRKYFSQSDSGQSDFLQLCSNYMVEINYLISKPDRGNPERPFKEFCTILLAGEIVGNQSGSPNIPPPVTSAEIEKTSANEEPLFVDAEPRRAILPLIGFAKRIGAENYNLALREMVSAPYPAPLKEAIEQGIQNFAELNKNEIRSIADDFIRTVQAVEPKTNIENIFESREAYNRSAGQVQDTIRVWNENKRIPSEKKLAALPHLISLSLILLANRQ